MLKELSDIKAAGWRVIKEPSYNAKDLSAEGKKDNAACWEVPCRRGRRFDGRAFHWDRKAKAVVAKPYKRKAHIYLHGNGTLGFSGKGLKLLRELLTVAGVRKHQVGDEEFSVIFPVASFDTVAGIVKPYRRRNKASVVAP